MGSVIGGVIVENKYGLMIIGARGHLATTVMAGVAAMKLGVCDTTGMVTALSPMCELGLPKPVDMVIGGWDIRDIDMDAVLRQIVGNDGVDSVSLESIHRMLVDNARHVYPGTTFNSGEAIEALSTEGMIRENKTASRMIEILKQDIARFRQENGVSDLAVVNLASTEPASADVGTDITLNELERAIRENDHTVLRASTLYAYAAIDAGAAYINFTPSAGAMIDGLIELARLRGTPIMGNDGKTGETLVKTALAPMFACRNLNVLSWQGYNILGNMDGAVLSHDENKQAKIRSKDKALAHILGYRPHSQVSIDYVPSLGDHKTAWDFIHFEGFLNTKMSLQFTWQGCDSALAAPLVLDLVRLGLYAKNRGECGLMPHLASFFKSPVGVDEHNLYAQYQMLEAYAKRRLNSTISESLQQNMGELPN